MKTTTILCTIYLFVNTSCLSQDKIFDRNEKVKMDILNEELKFLKTDSVIVLNLRIVNNHDSALLFHSFSDIEMGVPNPEFYKQPDITCGNSLFAYDSYGKFIKLRLINFESRYISPQSQYTSDSLADNVHKTKIVVLPSKSLNVSVEIQPQRKFLKPGRYTLFLIYYSGDNIHNLINVERNKQEKLQYKATNFYGYMVSNTVVLDVE